MFPVAFGANGQPPAPPTDASSETTPRSSAVIAFAYPVLRVLWKCAPTFAPRSRAPRTNAFTCVGTPTPIVSARQISSGGTAIKRSTRARTCGTGTGPSHGQPNATLLVTLIGTRSERARGTRARAVASPSSVVAFWLGRPKVSLAAKGDW